MESSYGGSDVVRVDSMDHGRQILGISPDFLTRLHALGKAHERFERLESKVEQLEVGTVQKTWLALLGNIKGLSPSRSFTQTFNRYCVSVA